jgi:hypothetical protein
MAQLAPEIEQQLADMSDGDWQALVARVRPPATSSGAAGKAEAEKRFGKKASL